MMTVNPSDKIIKQKTETQTNIDHTLTHMFFVGVVFTT